MNPAELAETIQPVIDGWMEGDHGGVIFTKELTDLIVEALTSQTPAYDPGDRCGNGDTICLGA